MVMRGYSKKEEERLAYEARERAFYEAREREYYEARERVLRDQYLNSHLPGLQFVLNPLVAGCSHCVEQRPMPPVSKSKVVLLCK